MMNSPVKKRDSHHSNSHQNRSSDFASTLKKWSAPIPPILLRKLGRVSDSPLGKVKVMLKVCDMAEEVSGTGILGVDTRKKQVTLIDPGGNSGPAGITITPEERRVDVSAPKMFAFDGIFGEEDDQAEICAAAGAELVASVVGGEDGCFVSLGYCTTGKKQTMFGRPANLKMGVVPTAISWLFKSIQEQKQKSGSRFSVRVSAVEVTGGSGHEIINDLLQPFAKDGDQPPGAYLLDSQGGVGGSSRGSKSSSVTAPILNTMSEVRAPNPETAGFYLDAALEAMSKEDPIRHFVFTLHVYQYTLDKNGKGAVVGGRSRLHCVMLGHGSPSISVLGGLLLAVLNGQRHLPSRDSKLGAILRECLGSLTCRAVVMIHISSAHSRYAETLAALQLGSRVHRLRRSRRLKMGSVGSGNGSGGSSGGSGEEMRMNSCLPSNGMSLNGGAVNGSGSLGCLGEGGEVTGSSDIDPSSSEQSCDTVIYLGPSIDDATDGEHPPVYLPSLENGSTDNTKCSLNGGGGSIPPPKTKSPKPKSNKVLDGSNFGGGGGNNGSSKSEEKWIDGPKVAKYRQMSNGVGTGSIGRSSHGHHSSHGHNSHGHELVMGVSGGGGGGGSGKKSETWIDGPAARVHHQGNNFPSPKKSVTQSNNHKTRSSSLATQPPGTGAGGGGGAVSQSVVDSPCSISSTKAEMIQKWISNQTHSNFLDDNNSSSHRSSLGFGLGDADADALSCLFGVGLRSHFQSGSSALYANLPPPTSVGPAVSSNGQSQNQSQSQSKNSSPHHYPNQIHSHHLAQQTLLQQQYMHQHQQSLHQQQQHHPHYSLYANTGHMRTQGGGHGMEPEFKALTVFKTCDDYEDGEEEILTLSQGKQGMRGECIENGFEFELIEVVEPEVPVPTRDACLQVTEEDIALSFLEVEENPLPESDQNFCMGGNQSYFSCRASSHHHRVRSNSLSDGTGNVEGLTEVLGNMNGSDQKTFLSLSEKNEDHPLRVLSQECLTVVSTFTDSLSINGGDMERFWPRLSFSGADDDMTLIDGHGQSPNGGHGHEMGICHGLCKNLVSLSQMSLTHGQCHGHNTHNNQTSQSQSPNCSNGHGAGGLVVAMEKKQPVSPCKNSSSSQGQNHSGLILSAEFTNSAPVPVPVSVPPPALSDESIFKLPRSPINSSPKIVTVPATTTATTTKKQGALTKGPNRNNDPQQSDAEQEAPIPPMKLLDLNPFLELELPGSNGSNVNPNNSNSNIHSSSLMSPRTADETSMQQCISPKSPVPTTMSLMRPNATRGCDHDHHNFNGHNSSTITSKISPHNGQQNGKNFILTSPQLPPPPSSLMSGVQIVNGNGNIHFHHSHSRGGSIVMETPSPPPASPLPELTKSPSKSKSRKIAKFFRSRSKSPKTAGAASTSSSDSGKSSVSVSGQSQDSVKADSLSLSPKVKLSSSSSSSSGASSTGVGVSVSVINNILNNKSPSKIKKSVCSSTLLKLPPNSHSASAGTPNGNGSVHNIDYQFTCDSSLPIFLPSPSPQQLVQVQVQPPSSLTIASKLSD